MSPSVLTDRDFHLPLSRDTKAQRLKLSLPVMFYALFTLTDQRKELYNQFKCINSPPKERRFALYNSDFLRGAKPGVTLSAFFLKGSGMGGRGGGGEKFWIGEEFKLSRVTHKR